ncbi:MAG: methyltransferase domain-containing protein [Cytophagaceae bacterium]|nr:methyltransferase domain-containing protein [Cytophagaceae bacterium]
MKQVNQDILEYYNSLAPAYDTDRFENSYGQFIHKQEGIFLTAILSKNTERILDMGCGTGRFLQFANYGIDFSPEMLKIAKAKYPDKKLSQSDAESTPFESNFFEQAFSLHVFMHLSKEKVSGILDEAYRILKPKGIFIFDFPSKKRRDLMSFSPKGWHGANDYTIRQIAELTASKWKIKTYSGILLLPVHRLPKFLRKYFIKIDSILCKSFLREYASYLIVVLEKK